MPDRRRHCLEGFDEDGRLRLRFRPPALLPIRAGHETVADYLASELDRLPRHVLLLVQAGAAAMGYWDGDELLAHKAIKKYVVRGRGRAQPLHLKTRGKSRYGSRLRLQNWGAQLAEVHARLADWERKLGMPELLLLSCPERLRAELRDSSDDPEAWARHEFARVPVDVHVPDFAELLAVHRRLGQGSVERWDEARSG